VPWIIIITTLKVKNMAQAKDGDTVKVHYTGKLQDGTVFDSSADRDPLQFTVGERQVIPGFEDSVIGMSPGESKIVEIASDKAYGPYRDEMAITLGRNQFPEHLNLQVDQQLQLVREDEQTFIVRVTEISDSTVTLDANHPLAGEDLTFDIQLIEIV
jgi:FKBP-type peptidyl-prolyl cis-trans isomerase 2